MRGIEVHREDAHNPHRYYQGTLGIDKITPDGDDSSDTHDAQDEHAPGVEQPRRQHAAAAAEGRLHRLEVHAALIVEVLVEHVDGYMGKQSAHESQCEVKGIYGMRFMNHH